MVAGEIHARCGERLADGPEREAFVTTALAHLAAARRAGFEPSRGWPEESSFGWLSGREAFAAAMRRE